MPTPRMQTGATAERVVCIDLERLGYRILGQNWRRPWGEIDVIAQKDEVIHFVEVKAATRRDDDFEPFLRANGRKMHKVQRTAETWLAAHRYSPDTEWQLDIASVILETQPPTIEYFENI